MSGSALVDPKKLADARERAHKRVQGARTRADLMVHGEAPDPMKLATYKLIASRPDLVAKIKAERGEAEWTRYEAAMKELERRLNGKGGINA